MGELVLSDKKLTRLNGKQLKRLAQTIAENNGASVEMRIGEGKYTNIHIPVINFKGKLKINIDTIRQAGVTCALSEIAKLSQNSIYENGTLIITGEN